MSKTITAWAVVDEDTGVAIYLRFDEAFARGLAKDHFTVVELTGELPDPPHEWKVGDWFKLGASAPCRILYLTDEQVAISSCPRPRGDMPPEMLAVWRRISLDDPLCVPCDPPAWFTDGGAS